MVGLILVRLCGFGWFMSRILFVVKIDLCLLWVEIVVFCWGCWCLVRSVMLLIGIGWELVLVFGIMRVEKVGYGWIGCLMYLRRVFVVKV